MSLILEVKDLQASFDPVNLLDGVSFNVEQDQTYTMVGESGSGKTTVIRAIAGLAPSQAGSVKFDGQENRWMSEKKLRPLRKDIAMMFQDPIGSLSPRFTKHNPITKPYKIQGMKDLDTGAKRLLETVNLPAHFADRGPY